MPDVATLFPQLAELDFDTLNQRRAALLGNRQSFTELDDEQLKELSVIATLLRRKASGPPREKKQNTGSKKAALSVDALDVQ